MLKTSQLLSVCCNKKVSNIKTSSIFSLLLASTIACGGSGGGGSGSNDNPPPPPTGDATIASRFTDATSQLPDGLSGRCMDAAAADFDGDGDQDIVLAIELGSNILLSNNGSGVFTIAANFPTSNRDSEDMIIEDVDGDGDIDIVFASEDDLVNELFLNSGSAAFTDESSRIPVGGVSNAVIPIDIDTDGDVDLILGNNGDNFVLLNDGNGNFTDATANIPMGGGVTQDLEAADLDGDGDLDIMIGNEGANALFINNGNQTFTDETNARLPGRISETRDIEIGDVDGDGDLDILVSNVNFFSGLDSSNYILINDGSGNFSEGTIPSMVGNHVDSDFLDLDSDGDLDILTVTAFVDTGVGNSFAYVNDGTGVFTGQNFSADGNGFDIESADFNGDGRMDLYFCNRRNGFGASVQGGQDSLYLAN